MTNKGKSVGPKDLKDVVVVEVVEVVVFLFYEREIKTSEAHINVPYTKQSINRCVFLFVCFVVIVVVVVVVVVVLVLAHIKGTNLIVLFQFLSGDGCSGVLHIAGTPKSYCFHSCHYDKS